MSKLTLTNKQETKQTNTHKKTAGSGTIDFSFSLSSSVAPPASSPGVGILAEALS
jgi:hypothetical protein